MADKHQSTTRSRDPKSGKHGSFKHTARPASFATLLRAYGMTEESFRQVKDYVSGRLEKKPAHAR